LDLSGNVCLNILREDWKPVLNLNAVMVGIQYLFLEPNADDPLNKGEPLYLVVSNCTTLLINPFPFFPADAANDLRANRDRFIQNVKTSMRGGYVGSEQFDDVRVGAQRG
jgi:ubiquitin-conjugating enzyme E2 M